MTAVNWLTSQPWPIFLVLWLGVLAVPLFPLLSVARRRQPRMREVSDWHMHPCGCLCTETVIHPCRHHKGQAARVLHQEAP